MDMAALRAVYDREMRMDAQFPDYEKEFFPNLVRMVNRTEHEGFIPYSRLTEEEADRVIAEQMQYFRDLNMEYEWKYYSYDTPADLKAALRRTVSRSATRPSWFWKSNGPGAAAPAGDP